MNVRRLAAGLAAGLALAATVAQAQADAQDVGRFVGSGPVPAPWRRITLSPGVAPTRYQLREWEGVTAVEAQAQASMALLARPLTVDLARTPVLCWRWWVDAPLRTADLGRKSGDDYAARVYVAFQLPAGALGWGTRAQLALARGVFGNEVPDAALNYVWDNRHPVGHTAPNAYTAQTRMVVVESGAANAGRWVEARRDVLADATTAFGVETITPTLLAVASDTDNTGETARAGFADLHFTARDTPCRF